MKQARLWLRRRVQDFKISRKISYSYALSLGVAILGTSLGLGLAHWQGQLAQQQFEQADRYLTNLYQLDHELLDIRSHPQRLLAILDEPAWLESEIAQFEGAAARVLKSADNLTALEKPAATVGVDPIDYVNLGRSYATLIQTYCQFVEQSVWQEVSQLRSNRQTLPEARQAILEATTSTEARQLRQNFERLSDRSEILLETARNEKKLAQAELKAARRLQLMIILSSMLLSALVAAALVHRTSRAIAQPIEHLTQTAESIVRSNRFTLDYFQGVPVHGKDEVASLARSLEQLVSWVNQYTAQLEESRSSLERRVSQRTQELTDTIEALNQAQMKLVQSETMSSLGQLVAGVAHEVNNPVGFIYGNISYAKDYVQRLLTVLQAYEAQVASPSPALQAMLNEAELDFVVEDLPKVLQSIQTGAERIHHIVRSLQKFSRLNEADVKQVDIHDCLDSTLLMLQHRLWLQSGETVQVVKRYGHLCPVECYPRLLNQVFINVVANALDALDAQSRTMKVSPSMVIVTTEQRGNRVAVTVTDSGPGIIPEVRQRLFDPFFTTKPAGQGVGLGLSISQEIIVKRHGGTLECFSEPGRGTRVVITIPVTQSAGALPLKAGSDRCPTER
ncbi:MAG: sensor histidine kinase [Elainellaceae cyanobacterium]